MHAHPLIISHYIQSATYTRKTVPQVVYGQSVHTDSLELVLRQHLHLFGGVQRLAAYSYILIIQQCVSCKGLRERTFQNELPTMHVFVNKSILDDHVA